MKTKPTARSVAAIALGRVTTEGAFAAAALEAELVRAVQLDPRDHGLATELVYGTLRVLPWLEARLNAYARKPVATLPEPVRSHLALAAYQLFFMRVPAFAAVNEAVSAVREALGERMSAFSNAVLRKVATEAAAATPELLQQARLASIPVWLRDALIASVGDEGARGILGGSEAPPAGLRVERAAERDGLLETLRAARPSASFEPGAVSPLSILARGAGKLEALPGHGEGAWSIQEEGSQAVALSLGARPGESVLDACAGRGNKTAILARAVGETGSVDACDLHTKKLARLKDELARVGLSARGLYAVDWSVGSGEVTATYDRVLVDAPCSGSGTLRRRPEISLRRKDNGLGEVAATELSILSRAATHVRPGGTLVYAICSVLREEAEAVVDALLASDPTLEAAPIAAPELAHLAQGASQLRLMPHLHGTDGYFIACFRKRSL